MNFDQMIQDVSSLGINLSSFAVSTPEGLFSHRLLPGSHCHNSYSVAKVFVVTALGMLSDEGRIRVTDRIGQYIPIPASADPRWHSATIEHAITHRLGFDEGFLDIDTEDASAFASEDYLALVFAHPLRYTPGEHEQYSDAAYYLLSRVFSAACGERMDTFLGRRLLRPLAFREAAWSRCPMDYPIGATGLYITSGDMVKLGMVYLSGGLWQGKRLFSREWADTVMTKGYEFSALTDDPNSDWIGKWGMYGQLLALSPSRRIAFACHGHISREDGAQLSSYLCSLQP